jgi:Uma2 family endonuclease
MDDVLAFPSRSPRSRTELPMSTWPTPSLPEILSGALAPTGKVLGDLYRMTVDEYERLADAGVLKDRRVELINGWLVKKMTTIPTHVIAVDATRQAIAGLLPLGWWLREEKPVRIPDFDEPEPDISVVRGSRNDYRARHPAPDDIEFLVEVSDTSLSWDRAGKMFAYARAGVPTYWILNLIDRELEIYSRPTPGGYEDRRVLKLGDQASIVIDQVEVGRIAVNDLLS